MQFENIAQFMNITSVNLMLLKHVQFMNIASIRMTNYYSVCKKCIIIYNNNMTCNGWIIVDNNNIVHLRKINTYTALFCGTLVCLIHVQHTCTLHCVENIAHFKPLILCGFIRNCVLHVALFCT